MSKRYDNWNEIKKHTDNTENYLQFKSREIYNAKIGENIGFEQNGKGDEFVRPVLILKRLTKDMFFGIPLSTIHRDGSFFIILNLSKEYKVRLYLFRHDFLVLKDC
jgi:mRNA interferase MazF